jgi:predicted methyltransferase
MWKVTSGTWRFQPARGIQSGTMVLRRLAIALLFVSLTAVCMWACSKPSATETAQGARIDAELRAALIGPARTDAETKRDVFRHPRETLEFFGLRDDMRVVELWAPDGYYTSVLAPVLHDHGELSVTLLDPGGDFSAVGANSKKIMTATSARFVERLDKAPEIYGLVHRIVMKPPVFSFGADRSADLVLTFRNVHNWIPEGYEDAVFAAAYRVLKPGGVLGVEEHRGAPDMTAKQIDDTGYVPVDLVIALATKAGFRLSGRSEINANPKDTKDYPDGVWSLPPTYALKDKDHAKYEAIGESDRMTLRFEKP